MSVPLCVRPALLDESPLEDVVAGSPTLEESYRRATTQKPIRERVLTQISPAGNLKRQLSNCQAGPTASSTPLSFSTPRCRGVGTIFVAGPLATSLPEVWVSGLLPPFQWRTECKGGDPRTDPEGMTLDPGLASRRESSLDNCHTKPKRDTREPAWAASTPKERGPKDPGVQKGGDPRTLASRRHWLLQVVAATAGTMCLDGRIRQPFSSPSRATLSGPSTPQLLPLCSGLMGESSVNGGML